MKNNSPYFGTMSGMATALGLLPHVLVLVFLMILKPPSATTSSIILFTIGSKVLGEWLFYNFFANRLDGVEGLNKWRTSLSKSLFYHNNVRLSVAAFASDHFIDILLIQAALKTQIHPAQIFCIFLSCQAVGSFFQGAISDMRSKKKCFLFSILVALVVQLGLLFFQKTTPSLSEGPLSMFGSLLGLNLLDPSNQMIIFLVVKGLFGNISTIARSAVASVVFSKSVGALETKGVRT